MKENSSKIFLTLKKGLLLVSLQHQSYLELKKYVGEEYARKSPLYSLESLKKNVRATARATRCSPHTVYLALEKGKKGNLRDSSYKSKSKHPHCVDTEKEQTVINYRRKSKSGKTSGTFFSVDWDPIG